MKIGVPKEVAANERRVALTPDVAGRLVKGGFDVVVERGAGTAAFFPDAAYTTVGVQIGDRSSVIGQSDIVLQVQAPHAAELMQYREGGALVAFFQPTSEFLRQLAQRKLTAFSLVFLPRITRAQPMDVLSSQATVAGYKAVLLAAGTLPPPACWCSARGSRDCRRSRRRAASERSSPRSMFAPPSRNRCRAWAPRFSRWRSRSTPRPRAAMPRSCRKRRTAKSWRSSRRP